MSWKTCIYKYTYLHLHILVSNCRLDVLEQIFTWTNCPGQIVVWANCHDTKLHMNFKSRINFLLRDVFLVPYNRVIHGPSAYRIIQSFFKENFHQLITRWKRSDLDDTQCVFVHHHHHHWIIRIRGSFPRTGLFLCVLYCHSFSSVLKLWRDDESGLVLKRPLANKRLSNRQQNHFFWVCYNRATDPGAAWDDNGFEC